jgi:hypothetical protein
MQGSLVKSIVVGSLVWLVVCFAGGFVVLARLGEYGSVVQLLIGVVMGLLGAASHVVLSVFSRFRRLNFLQRGLLNWLSAYLPLVAIAALLVNVKIAESDPNFWPEIAKLLLVYIGTPMLCLALLVSLITSTRAAQHGA